MKQHFYVTELENTHRDCEKIYKELKHLVDDITTIVEPYDNTGAMAFCIWSKNKDRDYKFILNTTNPFIKEMYEIMRDEEATKLFNETIENQRKYIFDDAESKKERVKRYREYREEKNVYSWFFTNRYFSMWGGNYPERKNKAMKEPTFDLKTLTIYEFYNNANIEFLTTSGLDIYEQYKTIQNTLIILNMPYVGPRYEPRTKIYEHFYNNDINNENAYIIALFENTWFIKLLFQHYMTTEEYEKERELFNSNTWYVIMNNFYL
jgi:hypothetical protein